MDFMIQLTWNSTVSILAQIYFLPPHSTTYFTAVSEHKNALSAVINIGFYHVLNEKPGCGSVAQQFKVSREAWSEAGVVERRNKGHKMDAKIDVKEAVISPENMIDMFLKKKGVKGNEAKDVKKIAMGYIK